jgi:hypothetical protein
MAEGILVPETFERLTFIEGSFKGKFMGSLDVLKSDVWHEQFFDIEILSGEISADKESIRPWILLEQEARPESELPIVGLPEQFPCQVLYPDGTKKLFVLNLKVVRFTNIELSHQVYEGQTVFGDINANISGFLEHEDIGVRSVIIPDPETWSADETDQQSEPVATGNREVENGRERFEFRRHDGSLFWSEWRLIQQESGLPFWQVFMMVISLLWVSSLVATLLFFLWRPILLIVMVVAIVLLLRLPWRGIKWYKKVLRSLGIGLLLFGSVLHLWFFFSNYAPWKKNRTTNTYSSSSSGSYSHSTDSGDSSGSILQPIPSSPAESRIGVGAPKFVESTQVSPRLRAWNGFQGQQYEMFLATPRPSEIAPSFKIRNDLPNRALSFNEYSKLVASMYQSDRTRLNDVYQALTALKLQHGLGHIGFAEMIISFVQSIPYTFLLPCDCDYPTISVSPIIKSLKKGGACKSFVKHGILSPVEFLENLQGDCDTRVLFLFTILDHFGYDVVMLNSQEFQHSLLGINLPLSGISKMIDGRRYVICDLSTPGLLPGSFPMEFSDMHFWHTVLISNQIPL